MDTVERYIEDNFDQSIYQDKDGSGFRGIDLPYRYTSPCIKGKGKFYFFFYWDTYFTNLGLLRTGRAQVAKENIQNMLWLIRRQGYMPNHVGIDNRSQAPYLCRMITEYLAATKDQAFTAEAADGLLAEYNFWMTARFSGTGLNHYGTQETWEGMEKFATIKRVSPLMPTRDDNLDHRRDVGFQFLAEAEATCDFTPRFGHRASEFDATDLNALLYEYELQLADFQEALQWNFGIDFTRRAAARKERINRYLWNEEIGYFYDYNFVTKTQSPVPCLTGLHMLFSGLADEAQAARMVDKLPWFELEHGVSFCAKTPDAEKYQWAFPKVWPPLVYVTVEGLRRYGYKAEARRIAQKYVDTTRRLFEKTGQLWEKTDALTGEVAGGEYDAAPMIGWSAGVYLALRDFLEDREKDSSL